MAQRQLKAISKKIYEQDSGTVRESNKQLQFVTNKLTGWKIVGTMFTAEASKLPPPPLI